MRFGSNDRPALLAEKPDGFSILPGSAPTVATK